MGTVRYTTVNGEIIAEKRNGVRSLYVPDPPGSTVALLDNTQTQTDTFSYWPYGEVNGRTGTIPTPFQFLGTAGYYQDSSSRDYVRARSLNTQHGRWMTKDPIGRRRGAANLYQYAVANPAAQFDPTGLEESVGGEIVRLFDRIIRRILIPRAPIVSFPLPVLPPIPDLGILPIIGIISTMPIGLYYGNYCGPTLYGQFGGPIDCIDIACMNHDSCLATWVEFCTPFRRFTCDQQLCHNAQFCLFACNTLRCRSVAAQVISLMCTLGTIPLPVGSPYIF